MALARVLLISVFRPISCPVSHCLCCQRDDRYQRVLHSRVYFDFRVESRRHFQNALQCFHKMSGLVTLPGLFPGE